MRRTGNVARGLENAAQARQHGPGGFALHVATRHEHLERNLDLPMESAVNTSILPDASGTACRTSARRVERRLREGGKLFPRAAHPQQGAARRPCPARARTRPAPRARRAGAFRHAARRRGNGPHRDRMVFRSVAIAADECRQILSPRADGSRCCSRTCPADGRNNFCAPAPGRRNSPAPCARRFCAPGRISKFQK